MNCPLLYVILIEKGGSDGIKWKLYDFWLRKWHFIELLENTFLPNYPYTASLSGVNRLSFYIYPTRICDSPWQFFTGLCMFFFCAYNGQTKVSYGLIYSSLTRISVIYHSTEIFHIWQKILSPKKIVPLRWIGEVVLYRSLLRGVLCCDGISVCCLLVLLRSIV